MINSGRNAHNFLKIAVGALLLLSMLNAFALVLANSQAPNIQWSKTYGSYQGFAVIQTIDQGFAIAGQNATHSVHGYTDYEPSLIKTNSVGELEWKTSVPVAGYAVSVVQTKDSGYAIGCRPGGWLFKLNAQGNVQWNKTLDSITCYIIQANDGNYVLAGSKENDNNGHNALLAKIDESGNLLWNKTFSELSIQWIEIDALIETNDQGYVIAGSWNSTSWFAKTDSNGNIQWNKTYNLANWDNSLDSIAVTNDGGYILGGFDQNGAWLVKTDSLGNLQWSRSYPGEGTFSSVAQTHDGGYVGAGDTRLVKTDGAGNFQWNATDKLNGAPWGVTITDDGGYAVTGFVSSSSDNTQNIWLAKFAPESGISPSPSVPEFPDPAVIIITLACLATATILFKKKWRDYK